MMNCAMGVRQNWTYLAATVASALIGGDAGGLQRLDQDTLAPSSLVLDAA